MDTKHEIIMDSLGVTQQVSPDPITPWSLPDTLFGLFFVLAFYFMTVIIILPDLMENRDPFRLKKLLLYYNTFQVMLSGYIVVIYLKYMYDFGIITTRCPKTEDLPEILQNIRPYFIAKHIDLLDTIFFVLRKKEEQKSFLHLYHHGAMVTWTWLHYMYHPTDHFVVVGMLNSFVHVLLYAYYGLSSLGPRYEKYLWWKRHLTKIQLVQFVLVLLDLYYQQKLSPCPIPDFFHNFCMFAIGSFFVLFMKFYIRKYTGSDKKVAADKKN